MVELYQSYRREAFEAMNVEGRYVLYSDNDVADMAEERQRFGEVGTSVETRMMTAAWSPQMRDIHTLKQKRERARARVALASVLLHTVPIGLVQFADYVSDGFVLVSFYLAGEYEPVMLVRFWVGLASVILSIIVVVVWALYTSRLPQERKWMVVLLSWTNLHVLYLGMHHSHARAQHADAYHTFSEPTGLR